MRHLADTYHLSKEAYLRKTPKNGKSRDQVRFSKAAPRRCGAEVDDDRVPRGPMMSSLNPLIVAALFASILIPTLVGSHMAEEPA